MAKKKKQVKTNNKKKTIVKKALRMPKKSLVKKKTKPLKSKKPVVNKKKQETKKKKNLKKKLLVKKINKKIQVVKTKKRPQVKKVVKKIQPAKIKKTNPRKANRKAKKTNVLKENKLFPAQSFFKARIKVIGIGGGGGAIVSEISRSLGKATFVIADTDNRVFKKKPGIKYFFFGKEHTHGLGTGLNPEVARLAAEQEKEKINSLFKDQDIVIFIASLGGGVGSGATQIFAEASQNFGGISLGIFTLPFKFEGGNKSRIALKSLAQLRRSLNVSITIPNERIFKVIDADTAIMEAFSIVNKNLIESLESLIDLIYNPGIINIDFADLQTILKGMGNLAFLNTAEASGANRGDKIIEDILNNHLYQSNNFIAEKILFNISGGNALSMFEVDKISRAIAERNPKAKIIFGISRNAKYKNKMKTTLLMTGPPLIKDPPPKVVVEKSIVVPEKKKVIKKNPKKAAMKKKVLPNVLPAFEMTPFITEESIKQIAIQTPSQRTFESEKSFEFNINKKTSRRTALEIKEAEELEEKKKSQQEKEWEIPAFLRLKK